MENNLESARSMLLMLWVNELVRCGAVCRADVEGIGLGRVDRARMMG